MNFINQLFQFWIESHWLIALSMSVGVNVAVYLSTAWALSFAINRIASADRFGQFIDGRILKPGQARWELRNGLIACLVFALGSLASRELFSTLWPSSLADLAYQVVCFVIFYETYSYFVHRLLHTRPFAKFHYVHHKSIRVTPWSAYSVHPLEALFIGFSAPIFMLLFSLSLGVALVLHVSGMMFTILLHSNFRYTGNSYILRMVFAYPELHAKHHANGKVNFGFVNRFWDLTFKTLDKEILLVSEVAHEQR